MKDPYILCIIADVLVHIIADQRFKIGASYFHPQKIIRIRNGRCIRKQTVGLFAEDEYRIQQDHACDPVGLSGRGDGRYDTALAAAEQIEMGGVDIFPAADRVDDGHQVFLLGKDGHVQRTANALAVRTAAAEVKTIGRIALFGQCLGVGRPILVRSAIAVGVDDSRQRSLYILWKIQDPIDLVLAPFDEEFFLRIGIVSIRIRCGGRRRIGYVFFVWRIEAAAEDHPQRQHAKQRTFHLHVRNDARRPAAGWLP